MIAEMLATINIAIMLNVAGGVLIAAAVMWVLWVVVNVTLAVIKLAWYLLNYGLNEK